MKTAKEVEKYIAELKGGGIPLSEAAWKAALACVGWPYIFGDRGEYCTPAHRRAAYNSKGGEHPTIKTKCKNFQGTGSCSGCGFYPGGVTRAFDCRGFTYWILLQIYGWKLMGAGATSQWNTESNWKARGEIGNMPRNTLCCLFVQKGKSMEHTSFGLNDETIECSAGVQHFTQRKAKWTHWGVPACVEGTISTPAAQAEDPGMGFPEKATWRPTLRKGCTGQDVMLCQTMLAALGYDLGRCGIDGDFGTMTKMAVIVFQRDKGLVADGICGPLTWDALEKAYQSVLSTKSEPEKLYKVTVTGLNQAQVQAIKDQYQGYDVIVEGE